MEKKYDSQRTWRIVVPAEKAYTSGKNGVYKVELPVVDGVDITHYTDIPRQV